MKNKDTQKAPKPKGFLSGLSILLFIIAFGLGILVQGKCNLYQAILNGLVSQKSMQRQKLKTILSLQKGPSAWSGFKIQKQTDHPTYTEQLLEFTGLDEDERLSAYLLIPKSPAASSASSKLPAALCIHGHHSTKENVAGVTSSPYNINYGLTLVQEGYIALVPDIRYSQDIWRLEDPMGLNFLLYGKSLTGERLRDLVRCITFLENYDRVDHDRIGVVGWSMGGGLALYLSAIDERVKLAYVSCYFGTYEGTIMPVRQSTDNYIPGIKNFGELPDVAALIAPRPLLIEHGYPDREFPVENAKTAFEQLKSAYAREGAAEKVKLVIREGGHKFYGDQLIPWFNQFFKAASGH
ncbi:MAG: dienelactone hydrolase family protein [bacterium]